MSIAALDAKGMAALRRHKHYGHWRLGVYGQRKSRARSVTVECERCGAVLIELVNKEVEDDIRGPKVLEEKSVLVQEGVAHSSTGSTAIYSVSDGDGVEGVIGTFVHGVPLHVFMKGWGRGAFYRVTVEVLKAGKKEKNPYWPHPRGKEA